MSLWIKASAKFLHTCILTLCSSAERSGEETRHAGDERAQPAAEAGDRTRTQTEAHGRGASVY